MSTSYPTVPERDFIRSEENQLDMVPGRIVWSRRGSTSTHPWDLSRVDVEGPVESLIPGPPASSTQPPVHVASHNCEDLLPRGPSVSDGLGEVRISEIPLFLSKVTAPNVGTTGTQSSRPVVG